MVGRRREEKYRHNSLPHTLVPTTRRKNQQITTNGEHSRNSESNNTHHPLNGIQLTFVVSRDMAHYCFDTLISHLKRTDIPKSRLPKFPNDP